MKLKLKYILTLIIFSPILFGQAGGSTGSANAREMAMGNTFTANTSGVYSVFHNPANLALPQRHRYEISTVLPLPNASIMAGSDIMSLDDFNYFFGWQGDYNSSGKKIGRTLTDADKQKLVNLFADGNTVNTEASFTLFALSVQAGKQTGAFAFAIRDRFAANAFLDKDFVEFVLKGNSPGSVHNFSDTGFESFYLREYSLSWARNMLDWFPINARGLYFGVTLKYLQGFAYGRFESTNLSIETLDTRELKVKGDALSTSAISADFGVDYDFANTDNDNTIGFFPSPAGSGLGLDLGITLKLDNALNAAISVTDIGKVSWTEETVEYRLDADKIINDFSEKDDLDTLKEIFDFKGKYIGEFSTSLPTALHIGASIRLDKIYGSKLNNLLMLAIDFHQGFNDSPFNSTKPRFSLGAEWMPSEWFAFRTGFSVGGRYGFQWSLGMGFDTGLLEFQFSTSDFQSFVSGSSAKRAAFSMGTRWKF